MPSPETEPNHFNETPINVVDQNTGEAVLVPVDHADRATRLGRLASQGQLVMRHDQSELITNVVAAQQDNRPLILR